MAIVYVVYHSGYGHTKLQAEAVHRGAALVSGVQANIRTTEEASANLDELDAADAIIFGCPTYMGNMSADMKKFIEVAASKWFTLAWKDKIAGAFTNSSSFSGDKLNTLLGLVINAMQHGMIYVGTGMLPAANRPEDMQLIAGPSPEALNRVGSFTGAIQGDIQTAEAYGKRIAEITLRWTKAKA
jgi:NAD(P)H dehydrogenase (quinone)